MKKNNYVLACFLILLISCGKSGDNNNTDNTPSITVGSQTWMQKNLDVSVFRNGDAIPQVTTVQELAARRTPAWCYYENDPSNGTTYGKMYNWYAINDSRGLAPQGWHVPTQSEWNTLATFLGGYSIAGGKLKSVSGWNAPNTGADNSSGFNALPGGTAYVYAGFALKGYAAQYWGSDDGSDPGVAFVFGLSTSDAQARQIMTDRRDAQYIRCVKN